MRIDFIFDAICPWCYIGKRRLDRALERRPQVAIEVGWWPYLLNRNMPGGGMPHEKYLERRFGGVERAQRVHGSIARAAADDDLRVNLDRIKVTPNTGPLQLWAPSEETHTVPLAPTATKVPLAKVMSRRVSPVPELTHCQVSCATAGPKVVRPSPARATARHRARGQGRARAKRNGQGTASVSIVPPYGLEP